MVRHNDMISPETIGFPHSRGDGPRPARSIQTRRRFSPLTWGWSDLQQVVAARDRVFPTHVGMVRCALRTRLRIRSFPHSRGDGPRRGRLLLDLGSFSPLTWGWSARHRERTGQQRVFPTHVGMVRDARVSHDCPGRFPHSRGDGPERRPMKVTLYEFSPLTWGWSGETPHESNPLRVFPTHVGMVRALIMVFDPLESFPHSRGDGPRLETTLTF